MPASAHDADTVNRFLEELSTSLDIEKTIKKLDITREDARAILNGLVTHKKAPHKEAGHKTHAYEVYVDGASRGNPGHAGAGAVIKDGQGRVVRKLKKYLGVTTNNMAEYHALIIGLEAARSMHITEVRVFADSELMVKQLNGVYRVKSMDLKPLFERASSLKNDFKEFHIAHVYRENNSIADSLANEAIDGR